MIVRLHETVEAEMEEEEEEQEVEKRPARRRVEEGRNMVVVVAIVIEIVKQRSRTRQGEKKDGREKVVESGKKAVSARFLRSRQSANLNSRARPTTAALLSLKQPPPMADASQQINGLGYLTPSSAAKAVSSADAAVSTNPPAANDGSTIGVQVEFGCVRSFLYQAGVL